MQLDRKKRDRDDQEERLPGEHERREGELAWLLVAALHEAQRRNGSLVVLKAPEPERTEVIARAQRLDHPGLARVLVSGDALGVSFQIVEDLRESRPLATVVEAKGPAHWQEAAALGASLANALDAVHAVGLVHARVAPDAIHVDPSWRPKLSVHARLLVLPGAKSPLAPRPFVAPEDRDGPSARGNLYSLGAVLYLILTGRAPADLFPVGPRDLVGEIPDRLERLVLDLLSLDPERRPVNASEVSARLDALLP